MFCNCPYVTGGEFDEQILDCTCHRCTNCGEVCPDGLILIEDGIELCADCLEPNEVAA